MKKNNYNRTMPIIQKDDQQSSDNWYNSFVSNLESNKISSSIYDEISAILGNTKPKYSNIEEAIQDMKDRSGLSKFLNTKQVLAFIKEPAIFQKIPEMKIFIDNFIEDRPGTSIESVVHDLLKINSIKDKLPSKTDVDDDVKAYINDKINMVDKQNADNNLNFDLGKTNTTNPIVVDDPLAICDPAKNKV